MFFHQLLTRDGKGEQHPFERCALINREISPMGEDRLKKTHMQQHYTERRVDFLWVVTETQGKPVVSEGLNGPAAGKQSLNI